MVTVGSILGGTFRFTRDNLGAVLVWSAILFAVSLVSMLTMQPYYAQQAAAQSGAAATPNLGLTAVSVLIFLAVFIVLWAAVYRAILFPEERRAFYLRFGMDEVRLLGTFLVLIVGGILVTMLFSVAVTLLVGLLSMVMGVGAAGLISGLLIVILVGAWIFLGVRLSLAGPLTILQRKVIIGPSWRATRGNFWRLLGAYVLIALLVSLAYLIVMAAQMGPILGDMMRPTDPAAHARVLAWQAAHYGFSAAGLISAIVGGLLGGFAVALQAGSTGIAAAQLLDRRGQQHLSEVFE
jgi:hypothetical protein